MEYTHKYEAAINLLLDWACSVDVEYVPLELSAGRVLAEDFLAREDVPSFERSPYDGYALRSADSKGARAEYPIALKVIEEIPAGRTPSLKLSEGTAAKVMTGAMLPEGADCVVMFERTDESVEGTVRLFEELLPGENVISIGEDVRKGEVLAKAGAIIDPGLAGSLAAQGVTEPLVYKVPKAGLISTGSEVVPADEDVPPGKIRNSNRYSLTAALRADGCDVQWFGIAEDRTESIAGMIVSSLESCDIVFLTGGVSVGDYDLTKDAMEAAGVDVLVHGVGIKPGMACCYGVKKQNRWQAQSHCYTCDQNGDGYQDRNQNGDEHRELSQNGDGYRDRDGNGDWDQNINQVNKLVIALSGNPASALTNYYSIVRPAVKKLRGMSYSSEILKQELFDVWLAKDFRKKSRATRFLRGQLVIREGQPMMELSQDQGNIVLSSTIGANMMAIVPAESTALKAGTVLKGFLL